MRTPAGRTAAACEREARAGFVIPWSPCARDHHPTDEDLSVEAPITHPTDEDLSAGTPNHHPTDEDLSAGPRITTPRIEDPTVTLDQGHPQ